MRSVFGIARFVLLEGLRSSLPWLALACIGASASLAAFLGEVALTETRELQAAASAAVLRASAVFLIAVHVVTSTTREASDRVLELALTLPISRSIYYAGKLVGFSGCAFLLSAAFAMPLLFWSTPGALASWWVSLTAEMTLVAAMALFFSMPFSGQVSAIAATAGLYLLGRSISTIQAIVAGPLAQAQDGILRGIVDSLALLVPRLDAVTRTEWLVYGLPGFGDLLGAMASLAIYCTLLAAAGLFDFSRRDL